MNTIWTGGGSILKRVHMAAVSNQIAYSIFSLSISPSKIFSQNIFRGIPSGGTYQMLQEWSCRW